MRRLGAAMRGVVALVGLCGLAACSTESGNTAQLATAPVPVVVALAEKRDMPVDLHAIGNVEPYATISIKPQVDGQLAAVHFAEGDRVHKGQLLFTIDQRPFEAALRWAEANLARDQAEAGNAELEFKRRSQLVAQGFVSQDEYDQSAARAASTRAAVKADQAAIENVRLQLQYCSIVAPIDGRVGQILVHAGNIVKQNDTTLAIINQIRPIYVSFAAPEGDLPQVRARAAEGDLTVEAHIAQDPDHVPRGALSFINNTVNTTTGTVLLKGLFANEDEALWPGQFVDVSLTLAIQHDVVVVPNEAIQTGQDGQYVFLVKSDDTAEVRPVTLTRVAGSLAIVGSGLAPGERVVTDGQVRLAAGVKVEIKRDPHAESQRAASSSGEVAGK
jgi:membrane fusion protein, multidrug efflux system